jgi:hypothetical protein
MTGALVNIATSFSQSPANEGRRRIFGLHATAARIMPEERVATCGRKAIFGHVDIRCGDRASYGGVETCGSVWMCPKCASRIAEHRRQEIRALADKHCRKGGSIYMAAFTIPHHAWQRVADLKKAVASSWSKVIAGSGWKKAIATAACIGGVRALEITVGRNGWHPHLHCVFFLEKDADAAEFGIFLFERWARIVARSGFGECNPDIWRFEKAANYDAVTDYVVKGNFDMELTRGHMKLAKGGGRSPWQLLADAREGDNRAVWLFREFATAFKGARQLTWFGDLREARSDLELAATEEPGKVIGRIHRDIFKLIWRRGLACDVLEAAERGGWSSVLEFLEGEGIRCHGSSSTI